VQFVGDFQIDGEICDRLVALHRACDRKGLVKRGVVAKGQYRVVNPEKKDSFDISVDDLPPALANEYGMDRYYAELQRCLELYVKQHPLLEQLGTFRVTESPSMQHYRPGGGFKTAHFERANFPTTTRMLVWMTYLNDVKDEGGTHFVYQKHTFEARRGRTLIWPSDFTHAHHGVVSPTEHKYIITGWFNFVPEPPKP
jgi:prolyl 4-hydroxylase